MPQFLVAFAVAWAIEQWAGHGTFSTVVTFPFFKRLLVDLGIFYIPFVAVVVVGSSNAVNLTDGLDGLAIGAVGIAAGTYAHPRLRDGQRRRRRATCRFRTSRSRESSPSSAGRSSGASLGFLWFNCHPAEIIMGDVGALSLGAAIAAVAVMTKQEVLLAIVGGLFVLEALSVILQVGSFKLPGKRIFKMAPLHHHFELARLGGVARHHPVLDPGDPLRGRRPLDPEAAMSALPMSRPPSTASPANLPRPVAVLGFARSGRALAEALLDRGVEVSVGDAARGGGVRGASSRRSPARGARFFFGGSPSELLAGADWLAISPGVPPDSPAVAAARARGECRSSPRSRSPGGSPRRRRPARTAGSP